MAKAYRGVLKARINKLYGGDVTCSKVNKLKANTSQAPIENKQPLYISENGYIPLEVAHSVYMRHRTLWGRYE